MKKIYLLLIAVTFLSCNNDDDNCQACDAQFVNIQTGEYIRQDSDCNRTPPEGYVFVKCFDGQPDY